jgi:uncharacterized protein YjaZ
MLMRHDNVTKRPRAHDNQQPPIVHEWHHLARWKGPGFGTQMIDGLISVGLAQHFETEALAVRPAFFSESLDSSMRKQMIRSLKEELTSETYDHNRWFFGRGEFPIQAGYS